MAAYELVSKGYKNVSVLKGGFLEWERSGRYSTPLWTYIDTVLAPLMV